MKHGFIINKKIIFCILLLFAINCPIHALKSLSNEDVDLILNKEIKPLYDNCKFEEVLDKLEELVDFKYACKYLIPKEARAKIYEKMGITYLDLEEPYTGAVCFSKAEHMYGKLNDAKGLMRHYYYMIYITCNFPVANIKPIPYVVKINRLELESSNSEVKAFANLGKILFAIRNVQYSGDFKEKYKKELLKVTNGENDDLNIIIFLNLGAAYLNSGDYDKSKKYYEKALEISEKYKSNKNIVESMAGLGNYYYSVGDYNNSILVYKEALKIAENVNYIRFIKNISENLGGIYKYLANYEDAIFYYNNNFEKQFELYMDIHQYGKAEKLLKNVGYCMDENILAKYYLNTNEYKKSIEVLPNLLSGGVLANNFLQTIYYNIILGKNYLALKKYEDAENKFKQNINLINDTRDKISSKNIKRYFYSGKSMGFKFTESYKSLVDLYIKKDKEKLAFKYSEHAKSINFRIFLKEDFDILKHNLPKEILDKTNDIENKIEEISEDVENNLKLVGEKRENKENYLKQLKIKKEEWVEQNKSIYPEYFYTKYNIVVSPSEIKLHENEILIAFEVCEDKTYAFFIEGGKIIHTRTINIDRFLFKKLVQKYRNYFENINTEEDILKDNTELSNKLYSLIFGDYLHNITKGKTLIIVPDEFLGAIPFEALVVEKPQNEKYAKNETGYFKLGIHYLSDDYNVAYAQSATAFHLARSKKERKKKQKNFFILCDPIFKISTTEQMNRLASIKNWQLMGIKGVEKKGYKKLVDEKSIFPRLEKTMAILENLKKNSKVKSLYGGKATKQKLKKIKFLKYKYLIFATHGILSNDIPYIKEPALVLGQKKCKTPLDGFFTMTDVMNTSMNAEVVALTACNTGLGINIQGEGIVGMGRAFQYAGCKNVLMSLWSVNEAASVEITNLFFEFLKKGQLPQQALKSARQELRRKGYENPFYWASFILILN